MINKIVILGSGNLAFHLCKALSMAGIEISQIFSRNLETASQLADMAGCTFTNEINKIDTSADTFLFAMTDEANLKIIKQLKPYPDKIMLHTAGSLSMNVFEGKTENYGVFYPFQTFSKNAKLDFSEVPLCLEASNKQTLNKLIKLSEKLRCKYYIINEAQRKVIHISGVFACNFMNHCISLGENILEENKIDKNILKALLKQSFEKLITNGAFASQTGPAVRQDYETMDKQIQFLKTNKTLLEIYKLMSQSIEETHFRDEKKN
ncbi:MAG: DUF2520 domain-containing protein [Bacteroidales bacterium]|nr:DUF2520 domain-containing protein [Bacteroidales bacterium]